MSPLFSPENPFVQILLAIGLGIFLGLRREIDFTQELAAQKKEKNAHNTAGFMGIRTMTLLSVLGVCSTLFPDFPQAPLFFFVSISFFVAISHAYGSFVLHRTGLTTEFAAMLMFWVGVLIGLNQTLLAIVLTIVLGSINAFKVQLRLFAGAITPHEWQSALQLLLLSGVILPFLPRTAIDPWGIFVPFSIWLLVILILIFEFIGYFLIKFYGAKGGIPLTGFLGSIVSSTAVTTSLAARSKQSPHTDLFAGAILIALGTMQIRVMIEIVVLSSIDFWQTFILVPISMAIISFAGGFYYIKKTHTPTEDTPKKEIDLHLGSPLEIIPALKFGAIFLFILTALGVAQYFLGESGVYVASFLSGLLDIDAIVLSSLESLRLGTLLPSTTKNAIFIAIVVNTLIKIVYLLLMSNKNVTWAVTKITILSTLVGSSTLFFF